MGEEKVSHGSHLYRHHRRNGVTERKADVGKRGLSAPGWVLVDGNSAEIYKGRKEHPFKSYTGDHGLDVLLPWEREDKRLGASKRILVVERASLPNYSLWLLK